jgi:hypothetical protein
LANPRLSIETKVRRGTVRPCRERATPARRPPARLRNAAGRFARKQVTQLVAEPAAPVDFTAVAVSYAADVVNSRIVAGSWLVKACRRFQRDLTRAAN